MNDNLSGLLIDAQAGKKQAFNRIVELFQKRVFRVAYTVLRQTEEADEITQEVFVKFYKNLNTIEKPESLKAWLMRTTVSTSIDRVRWLKLRSWFGKSGVDAEEISTDQVSAEARSIMENRHEILNRWADANLGKKERLVFQLKYGEDMTISEIGTALSMNENTIKTHLNRAQKKLKTAGKEFGYE